jgi:hypothetical protein
LLYLLYWSASGTVAITSNSSRPYEELVLAVFSQQWPRLRRNFSFCTGALAIRDPAFDCVVAPHDALRQDAVGRSAITLMPADPKLMGEQSSEDWVRVAVNDLLMTDLERPLRRFLWKFGPDYIEGRKAFRPLCEIYLAASRSRESVEQALSATAHFFPDIDSAVRLKTEFFGSRGSFSRESRGEALVLQALVTHPAGGCVPEDIAAIEQRARLLVRSEKDGAIRVAVAASSVGGIRAEQYLDGFAAGVISNPELLYVMSPSLKSDLLTRNPALLTLPELWRGPTDQQLAIAAHVASLRSLSRLAAPITRAILSAEAWPCLPSVLAKFGKGAVAETLAWVDQIPQSTLSLEQPVLEALGEQRSVLAEVLQQKPLGARALRVASALLDPRADVIRALGAKVWVGLVGADIHLASLNAEVRSKAFLLSLGLSLSGEGDVQLVREGFSTVYDAARTSRLDDEVWHFLEPYLPWYLATWDRCARLIRGVVRLFVDRHWPASEFLATYAVGEQLTRALEEADRSGGGRRYIKKMRKLIAIGSLGVDKTHLEAVKEYWSRR